MGDGVNEGLQLTVSFLQGGGALGDGLFQPFLGLFLIGDVVEIDGHAFIPRVEMGFNPESAFGEELFEGAGFLFGQGAVELLVETGAG